MNSLKVCFIGVGSIAKRHMKNLRIIAEKRKIKLTIDALRRRIVSDEEQGSDIHRSYIEGKSEQAMMTYFDMTIAVHKEGIYVRDLIDINKNKKNKSERKSILDEINKSHSEVRLNNDIKLQNYYKNIIEKVS
ncbi:MAG: hypothetical protein HFG86_12530 [Dorea sp.]|nr:hypothetical protein [Dorea sp.]